MHPDRDDLALAFLPVPVRKKMQDGILPPPSLVVIEVVFREAAHVNDAELRVDGWPTIWSGLPTIVEAGPGKATGEPFTSGVELPPLFGKFRPRSVVQIVGADPVAKLVGLIDAARGNCACGFRADARRLRMPPVPPIAHLEVVIESHDIQLLWEVSFEGLVHGGRAQARRIKFVRSFYHLVNDADALRLWHHDPLFVAHGPDNDRRRIAISLDHQLELRQTFRVGTHWSGL